MKLDLLRSTRPDQRGGWGSLILIVFFAFALVGCGASGTSSIDTGDSSSSTSSVSSSSSSTATPSGDAASPTVAITGPTSSASYTSPSDTPSLSGTASDNVGVTEVTWTNSLGGSGTATGTSSWTLSGLVLQPGTNKITVTARDAAGNTGTASLDVAYTMKYYISPSGSDTNSGRSTLAPWKAFAKAFSTMAAGDELVLLDGTYSATAGTGVIHWDTSTYGAASAQPPSGSSLTAMTYVHALNPGQVVIDGQLFIGRKARKDSYIKIQGITFEGGGHLYNADYSTVKDSGFHGAFTVGTPDHNQNNDNNLIEDVWIWASGARVIAINYRSHFNVWRRVLVRGDGCGLAACQGAGNPNVGISVYDSNNISFQNVMVVDRILDSLDSPYADFATAQHTSGQATYFLGENEWLGTVSIKAPDQGYDFEADAIYNPTIKVKNAVAWDSANTGVNIGVGFGNMIENVTSKSTGLDGIRVAPLYDRLTAGTLRNAVVAGAGRYGINSSFTPSYANVFGTASAAYNQTNCATGCRTSNPTADGATPSLKYLPRIETGSVLKGAGFEGADIGANIVFRYGADGTRFGETNYNALTATPLWPWPNEVRIKSQMCASTKRGFCSSAAPLGSGGSVPSATTLTTYIWEYLGNPIPAGIYP